MANAEITAMLRRYDPLKSSTPIHCSRSEGSGIKGSDHG